MPMAIWLTEPIARIMTRDTGCGFALLEAEASTAPVMQVI